MKKFIISLLCISIVVQANSQSFESTNIIRLTNKQSITSQPDTLINSEYLNFAVLVVDYDTYDFEGGNLSYYQNCDNCTEDSIPFEIEVIYPGDFGGITYNIQHTLETVFDATIIWMGTGQIVHPENFSLSYPFNTINNLVEKPKHIEYYDKYGTKVYTDSIFIKAADSAWQKIESLEITKIFSENNFKVGIYLYPPYVGIFSPEAAKWIIFFYLDDFNAAVQTPNDNNETQLSLYPNPCKEYLTFCIPSFNLENYGLEILDLYGRCILKLINQSPETEKINVSSLDTGTYVLKIHNSESQYTAIFVKN